MSTESQRSGPAESGVGPWRSRWDGFRAALRRDGLRRSLVQFWSVLTHDGPRAACRRAVSYFDATARDVERVGAGSADGSGAVTSGAVLFVSDCPGATRRYRCEHPMLDLQRAGYASRLVVWPANDPRDYAANFELLCLQRVPWGPVLEKTVDSARAKGAKIIFDVDDLLIHERFFDELGAHILDDPVERELTRGHVRQMQATIERADLVFASTESLAALLREAFPKTPVRVVRNRASQRMVELAERAVARSPGGAREDAVVFGYFSGTKTHDHHLAMIAPSLAEALAERATMRLLLVGELRVPEILTRFGARVEKRPLVPLDEVWTHYRSADVHLAPLGDSAFDRSKSEIKWIEAGLVERATIASHSGAYPEVVEDRVDGLLVRESQGWKRALVELHDDEALRDALAKRARARAVSGARASAAPYLELLGARELAS